MNPLLIVIIVLGVLLSLSTAGNAWFWHERDGLLQREATVKQLQADTKAAATACSESVDNLAKAGQARDKRIEAALKGIAPAVKADQEAAIRALGAKPDNPQDLCGSLERLLRREIKAERGVAK